MNQEPNPPFTLSGFLPRDIAGFETLAELALNLRWAWNHASDSIWHQLDPELWAMTHNPWVILQTVSRERLDAHLADAAFRKNLDQLLATRRHKLSAPAWFQQRHPQSALKCIAYFSMEFMLSEALPIYSGGLGNVAGDQLKAASDLGVPVVGVGLLFQCGYFRQVIDEDGAQQALYPYNDPNQLPVAPLRDAKGEWLRLKIELPGYVVWLRTWQVQVGRIKLYLLDSNDSANLPVHRAITSELYGGDAELRLRQELVLGIGGWRLLETLGLEPQVCHLNEGHAAFAVLERARSFMARSGQPFSAALAATRAGNLFTTHTAVAAGFDHFEPALIEQYLTVYATQALGITAQALLALGRAQPWDRNEPFNMAYLAIRGSGAVNGVSRLHGQVSRQLFAPLFPRWPENEVPVGHVTNGVHMPTWDSAAADELWTEACGKNRWLGLTTNLEQDIRRVSDSALWRLRSVSRKSLINYARARLSQQLASSGASEHEVEDAGRLFDPNILTLGFARRFASYKRPNLLLHDTARLLRILSNTARPVQLIIAGKAHPEDRIGQALIKDWVRFIRSPEVRPHILFLSDYDMLLAAQLVQGVDVWINTPRRPWEASGTSGMKVLVNGGINLSELDGWWAEAWMPDVGWALGDGHEHADAAAWDAAEAGALYSLLENEVVPEFYERDASDIPLRWTRRMRESMASLTPQYSASRSVVEYTEQHYVPMAQAVSLRLSDNGLEGREIDDWHHELQQKWPRMHFVSCSVEVKENRTVVEAWVDLADLAPEAVRVELYANGHGEDAPLRQVMLCEPQLEASSTVRIYRAILTGPRPASDFTARVLPLHRSAMLPLEANEILWQH